MTKGNIYCNILINVNLRNINMNCPRRKSFSLVLFLLFLSVFISSPTHVQADYASIALLPSTGTIYADYTALSLVVNSGSDEFYGVDVNIAFTGSVVYMESTGASRCSSFVTTGGAGTINVECLSTAHAEGETYSGVVATLYFRSTGTGTSTFTFTSTDPNILTKTGGTYTLSTENNPVPRGGSAGGGLPESGIFDDTRSIIAIGAVLMLVGIFFNQVNQYTVSLLGNISGKVKESKQKREEEKISKRRGKLEKRF